MGGTMRLGAYPAKLTAGSLVAKAYGATEVSERHRHRYEVNNAYRDRLAKTRAWCSPARSPDDRLVEFVELPADEHPFFVGTQAHPELKSRPDPAASAVRRVRRRRAGLLGRRAAAGRAARGRGGRCR